MVVRALVEEHGMSQRRACQTSGIARSTLRYRPVACDDSGVITFIQAYMALNSRHGFRLNRPGFSRHLRASNLRPNRGCHE
jgi:putative transposase